MSNDKTLNERAEAYDIHGALGKYHNFLLLRFQNKTTPQIEDEIANLENEICKAFSLAGTQDKDMDEEQLKELFFSDFHECENRPVTVEWHWQWIFKNIINKK